MKTRGKSLLCTIIFIHILSLSYKQSYSIQRSSNNVDIPSISHHHHEFRKHPLSQPRILLYHHHHQGLVDRILNFALYLHNFQKYYYNPHKQCMQMDQA
ncbi:unnamed protein product [Paramecium octaurelia]|uniref:Uncharacterized protein n=1 Tax=Paramecium octaurelia TaxID=43137 RepID=A0A8S1WLV7_PAROT|nr:unnamed protein product [Paramecium octaurelia]